MRLRGPVDLFASLQGGQAFRWRREGDAFHGAIEGHVVAMHAAPGLDVEARASPRIGRPALERYLGLGPDADARFARLSRDPALAPALAAHPGVRVLRQDPWETTVAFITSANNNVLRIEGILSRIAAKWGEPLGDDHFAFPSADTLGRARESSLRAMGLGYRAPFVREAARCIARGDVDLASLRGAAPEEAREALLALPGVGPKVADCIALFSLDVPGAFPIDRWVERVMADTFFGGAMQRPHAIEAFARERWGDDAGHAQQVLFHAVRLQAGGVGTKRLAAPGPGVGPRASRR